MDVFQVREAIREVKGLKQAILHKQRFRGFSGRARALGGLLALGAGLVLEAWPQEPSSIVIFVTWGLVFLGAVGFNYGALVFWLLRQDPVVRRRVPWEHLLDVGAVWFAGGLLTFGLWRAGETDLLYGMWMLLFGVAQLITRTFLPSVIRWLALAYLGAGGVCLLLAPGLFHTPLVMGVVFFVGELAGAIIFHTEGERQRLRSLLGWSPRIPEPTP